MHCIRWTNSSQTSGCLHATWPEWPSSAAQPYYAESQVKATFTCRSCRSPLSAFKTHTDFFCVAIGRGHPRSCARTGGQSSARREHPSFRSGLYRRTSWNPSVRLRRGLSDWDLRQAAALARLAGFPVTQDFNTVEFGTSTTPLRCDNAALYAGGYRLATTTMRLPGTPGRSVSISTARRRTIRVVEQTGRPMPSSMASTVTSAQVRAKPTGPAPSRWYISKSLRRRQYGRRLDAQHHVAEMDSHEYG